MRDVARHFTMGTSMTKNVEETAGDLAAGFAALRDEVSKLAETMRALVQQQARAAGHHVSDAVGDVTDKIATSATDVQNRVRTASGEIEARIERNPLTTMLIILAIGISLGMLSRSRG